MIELPTEADPVKVVEGDCLEVLKSLPDGCVDAVVTDPPYSSGGAFRGDRMGGTVAKYTTSYGKRDLPEFGGDNRDQRAYGYWCALWLSECLRLTKPAGVCCLFTDWRQIGTTIDAIQAGGWVYRGVAVWDKTEAARPMKGRFRNQCEFIVWGSRGPMGDEGECLPGVFRRAVAGMGKEHTAQKPIEVMRGLLAISQPNATILDPFAGSGTTGVAAALEGRRCLLIEKEPAYAAICRERVRKVLSAGMFEGIEEGAA